MSKKSLEEIKEALVEHGYEDTIVFENPGYEDAFIGVSHDGRAIYDYNLMVESLAKEDEMTFEDAAEFIDYNTIRALPYIGERAPIIKMDIE